MSIITLNKISKFYKKAAQEYVVLKDFDYVFESGEFHMIMGASGCGKTSLLNIISGLDENYSGEYLLAEENFKSLSTFQKSKRRAMNFGYIHQLYYLLNEYTVLENVILKLMCQNKYITKKVSKKEIKERSEDVLIKVGLLDHLNKYPHELSGGQIQRVGIARALVGNPSVILADEPTGALDSKTSREIIDILSEIQSQGTTIIMVTHDLTLKEYSTKTLYL